MPHRSAAVTQAMGVLLTPERLSSYLAATGGDLDRAGDLLSDTDYQRLLEVTAARRAASRR
jgi:hypothetical protein